MPVPSRSVRRLILPCTMLITAACIIARRVNVSPVEAAGDSTVVASAVRAHLVDGSTVVYLNGVTILRDTVRGSGERFSLMLAHVGAAAAVPLDSILGMESFRTQVDGNRTVRLSLYTAVGIVAAVGIGVAIACASDPKCFGSCPTFYSDSGGTPILEAEGFSYSVAPLLEARDIDRLRARPSKDGFVRLEVRNEAMETQYTNHLEVLEVSHARDEYVVPDDRGRPLALSAILPPPIMRDRRGADVTRTLALADGQVYRTSAATMAAVRLEDVTDHIDVAMPRPAGADSVVMLLRMRNSLLNTVLFYDFMLGRPGARSIDWVAHSLDSLANAVELGRWYTERFGLRLSVMDGGRYREVARLSDQGPVAWRDVALVVPVAGAGDSLRMRVSFIADEWRIDRIAIAPTWRHAAARTISISSVTRLDGTPEPGALESMRQADEQYLETTMGQALIAGFDVGAEPASGTRTFMLASQGYYSEWVRREWIRSARTPTPFVPSDSTLLAVVKEWRSVQDDMERRFYATRIPVR